MACAVESSTLIRAALQFLPVSLHRDEWVRVAMAIKNTFLGVTSFELFEAWSQTGLEYATKARHGNRPSHHLDSLTPSA